MKVDEIVSQTVLICPKDSSTPIYVVTIVNMYEKDGEAITHLQVSYFRKKNTKYCAWLESILSYITPAPYFAALFVLMCACRTCHKCGTVDHVCHTFLHRTGGPSCLHYYFFRHFLQMLKVILYLGSRSQIHMTQCTLQVAFECKISFFNNGISAIKTQLNNKNL